MNDDERTQRARSFGQVAELYERWRPGYPDALYADVLELGPGGRVLEAGAGTGRATLALAQRGASVVAVEPDAAMAALIRRSTQGLAVEVRESTFEECDVAPGAFDLVVAAQSWHWMDQERGVAVAARALRSGGALCLWWNRPGDLTGAVWNAVHNAYAEHAPELDRRALLQRRAHAEQQFGPLPGFTPWTSRAYDWLETYDADSYAGLVQTHSDHLRLPLPQRERLVGAICSAIIDVGGGRLEYRYRTILLMARVH